MLSYQCDIGGCAFVKNCAQSALMSYLHEPILAHHRMSLNLGWCACFLTNRIGYTFLSGVPMR